MGIVSAAAAVATRLPSAIGRVLQAFVRALLRAAVRQLVRRPVRRARIWHLEYQIRHAEVDRARFEQELADLPQQIALHGRHLDTLRVQLIDAERPL
jgi:hypothetical protein